MKRRPCIRCDNMTSSPAFHILCRHAPPPPPSPVGPPLQHMHCFITFDTMRKCSVNILASLTPIQYREARVHIMSLILATDLQQHFEVSSFVVCMPSCAQPSRLHAHLILLDLSLFPSDSWSLQVGSRRRYQASGPGANEDRDVHTAADASGTQGTLHRHTVLLFRCTVTERRH